jgi:hypothetical protein
MQPRLSVSLICSPMTLTQCNREGSSVSVSLICSPMTLTQCNHEGSRVSVSPICFPMTLTQSLVRFASLKQTACVLHFHLYKVSTGTLNSVLSLSLMFYSPIFLVLSHTFGYLEQKLLGRLWKSLDFLKSNFYVSENFKFQCDPFSNKNMFHKGPVAANGACQK